MKIIAISGKARHGKSETAKIIKKELENKGNKVLVLPLAKYLKRLLIDHYGWDGITKDQNYRDLLQKIGTDTIREQLHMPLFHVTNLTNEIKICQALNLYDYYLIDDARFLDEVAGIQSIFPYDLITLRVVRLGKFDDGLSPEQRLHRSETDMDFFKFDRIIYSQHSLDHLHDETIRVMKSLHLI